MVAIVDFMVTWIGPKLSIINSNGVIRPIRDNITSTVAATGVDKMKHAYSEP